MSYTIFFDVETGGIEPHRPTIQLAAVVMNDLTWEEVDCFERKISFNEADADPAALKLNHYDAEYWELAKPPLAVAQEFCAFARPYLTITMISKRTGNPYQVGKLAGHNALTFDLPRLRQMFGASFFPFSYHVKDTLQRALWYYDEHPSVTRPENLKLSTLCSAFNIATYGAHDALSDTRMCAALAHAFSKADRNGY